MIAALLLGIGWALTSPAPAQSPKPAAAARASAGCGKIPLPPGQHKLSAMDGEGRARSYQLVAPADYTGRAPLILAFAFHGAGASGRDALSWGIQETSGARTGAIFVAPDGVQFRNLGVGWNDYCDGYDIALFDRIVADVQDKYCIDLDRIVAYGFSWGGDFTSALLCCRGDRLRRIVVNSASDEFSNPADYLTYQNLNNGKCPVQSTAAVRFTHAENYDSGYPAPLFSTTSKLLRSIQGCSAKAVPAGPGMCVSYQSCRAPLLECVYPGHGHAMPANSAQDIWDFISQ